eukprot:TRINITY_DN618_c0_g2_i1.p2 TRINITY_DN618_c0_g2~~TRINITY_DN618_c0_g2_i1.p2  ORF type:complete len:178 (+),score=58.04 TRINITY_DN618_c0_g2_i1:736-1269(+)
MPAARGTNSTAERHEGFWLKGSSCVNQFSSDLLLRVLTLPVTMSMFKRFVEPGRLAVITYGPCEGKMCTVVDIVDQKRVIVDGPEALTGVRRHMMPVKRLSLTDFKATIPRGAREKTLKKALEKDEIMKQWDATPWGSKLRVRKVRQGMNDFERFKLYQAKKKRSQLVKKTLKPKKK